MRVLVAEPEPRLSALILQVLADAGCTVTALGEGNAALAAARSGEFDVLVLDDTLPGLSGQGVLRALREHGDAIPALLVGGEPADTGEPCSLAELAGRLERLCERSGGTHMVTLPEGEAWSGGRATSVRAVPAPRSRQPWQAVQVLDLVRRTG